MPATSSVEWDPDLESFKGRSTTTYAAAAAAAATECAACHMPVTARTPLALSVDVTGGTHEDGTEYFSFETQICHRVCRPPALTFTVGHSSPIEFTPQAARLILQNPLTGSSTAALVFTYLPMMSFREPGGELTSALVTALLRNGFQLAMGADVGGILRDTGPAAGDVTCPVTDAGVLTLRAGQATMYHEQLDPADPDDTAWLAVARSGTVLVIGGDNLTFNSAGPDLDAAAQLGTLAAGMVPVIASTQDRSEGTTALPGSADDPPVTE
ncbi:hypothetical protein ACFRAU_25085 [Arthrobacter sp. NPDC056691]|uniref:hypothetical protein n=1 Tax=Arthrobacter sp. NPDC056691 TaxID=3345913 RepID=UPI00366F8D01